VLGVLVKTEVEYISYGVYKWYATVSLWNRNGINWHEIRRTIKWTKNADNLRKSSNSVPNFSEI